MLKIDGVLWHITMSLDGFVADKNDTLDCFAGYEGPNPLASEIMANIGAILSGRRTYDINKQPEGGEAYGGEVSVPEFVVTNRPAPVGHRSGLRFLPGNDLPGAVQTAKAAADGRLVVIIGPGLAGSMLEAGLIDQVAIHIVPVLLGSGTRLFDRDTELRKLETVHVSESGPVINLLLRPRPN
jgi:dihydrofolate reductase